MNKKLLNNPVLQQILKQCNPDTGICPVIMGPTASGKSALALEIAESFHGEIISADSMQFYKGLDIGTAKPDHSEQARVPHHLLDTLDIHEKADIFMFCQKAEQILKEIRQRKCLPIVAGGSGLYLRAFIYGLDPLPAQESLRKELDTKYDSDDGFPALQKIMAEECPGDFERFSRHRRKLIRAYEVFLLTGKQITDLQNTRIQPEARKDICSVVLSWDRDILKERIRTRCREMLKQGWIEETEQLIQQGLLQTPTAWQALGYPIIAEYLQGNLSYEELPEKISIATWQFARRQITWFKHQHPEALVLEMPF